MYNNNSQVKKIKNVLILLITYLRNYLHLNAVLFIFQANKNKLISAPYRWILINKKSTIPNELFDDLNILIDSDVTIASYQSENYSSITKIYQRRRFLPVVTEDVGFWKLNTGFISTATTLILATRRKNLMGTTLNTSLVITHNDSLNHLLDKR